MSLKLYNRQNAETSDKQSLVKFIWFEKCLERTDALTTRQVLWASIYTGISIYLGFSVNFAIGCLLFVGGSKDAVLFDFPDSILCFLMLCTNVALTVIWYFSGVWMSHDVLNGKIAPLNSAYLPWWPAKTSKLYWWFQISDLVVKPSGEKHISLRKRVFWGHIRSTPRIMILQFIIMPPVLGYCYATWGNKNYDKDYLPAFILAVYGALLALVTPLWAVMVLADFGDRLEEEKLKKLSEVKV
jgi:hypothetical protein